MSKRARSPTTELTETRKLRTFRGGPGAVSCIQSSAWTPSDATANVAAMARMAQPDPALAAAIRTMREARGLTREDVAYQAGVTVGSLARIELAQSAPAWATVAQIAQAMNVPLVVLVRAVEELQ